MSNGRIVKYMRSVWRELRHYPQGCNIEIDYRFIRSIAATVSADSPAAAI